MATDLPDALLEPIAPDRPGGDDVALAPDLDEIREARRGDDPSLSQGDWVRDLRSPQWPRVRSLCERVLAQRSKDLQVACWYAEALVRLDGFKGLARGLGLLEGLLETYWDHCWPALDEGSAEERAGRFEWLEANLVPAVRQIPLTAPDTGGLTWLDLEAAKAVDNLALRDIQARDAALAEGRLTVEAFQKAVLASGRPFHRDLLAQVEAARDRCRALQASLDQRFGLDGPGLEGLARAIEDAHGLAAQAARDPSGPAPVGDPPTPLRPDPAAGAPPDRAQAIRTLRAAAAYFHRTEPHSPVAYLAERAAQWAEMPLDAWLADVIKDPPTLAQIRELLSLHPPANK